MAEVPTTYAAAPVLTMAEAPIGPTTAPGATYGTLPQVVSYAAQQPVMTSSGFMASPMMSGYAMQAPTMSSVGKAFMQSSVPRPPMTPNDPNNLFAAGQIVAQHEITIEELAAEGRYREDSGATRQTFVPASAEMLAAHAAPGMSMPLMSSPQAMTTAQMYASPALYGAPQAVMSPGQPVMSVAQPMVTTAYAMPQPVLTGAGMAPQMTAPQVAYASSYELPGGSWG